MEDIPEDETLLVMSFVLHLGPVMLLKYFVIGAWCSGELFVELESASFSESFSVKSLSLVSGDGSEIEKLDWELSATSQEMGGSSVNLFTLSHAEDGFNIVTPFIMLSLLNF